MMPWQIYADYLGDRGMDTRLFRSFEPLYEHRVHMDYSVTGIHNRALGHDYLNYDNVAARCNGDGPTGNGNGDGFGDTDYNFAGDGFGFGLDCSDMDGDGWSEREIRYLVYWVDV